MNYDDIFQRGQQNVLAVWQLIDQQLAGSEEPALSAPPGWNLDTGRKADDKLLY